VAALGPLSIGTPDAGLLVNPLQMPAGPYWKVRNPLETYGTAETIEFILTAVEEVEARFPGSPRLVVGDISRRDGGRLNRHRSHQAGRDVDLGFYYAAGEAQDFAMVRRKDLDLPRTWALVRALLTETDVDRIFVDRSIMALLYTYARNEENEDEDWLDDVFGRLGEQHKGVIQHERGHRNHLHVRFFNQRAQEYGRVVYPVLVEEGVVPPPRVKHRVRRGETIGLLAARYGTSVSAIRAANGLRGNSLRAGRSYTIPIRRVPEDGGPIVVPPRRLPPGSPALAHAGGAAVVPEMAEAR
jgi:penicillin-insensitive murein endopeptidase